MKILYNLTGIQPSATAKFHGGGYYGEALFFALIKKTNNVIGIYNSKRYINPKILECNIKIYDINSISPKEIIEKENITTFYTVLYHDGDEWKFNVNRYIITWHGLRELEMPVNSIIISYSSNLKKILKNLHKLIFKNYYIKKYIKKTILNKSTTDFITVSQHSKASIINFFPQFAEKQIPVFYPPSMIEEETVTGKLHLSLKEKKYFLLSSSARWEKNNLRAVIAFDQIISSRKCFDYKIVLTGVILEKIFTKKIKNKNNFVFLNYISREDLLILHKNAYAFIYPSLNEGFGYPPIESMRYGVPVAASGTSSIPEICQNAAIYFDPYNISEIKNRIIQLLDNNIYEEYSKRAVNHYKKISEKQKNDLIGIVDYIIGE